MSVIADAAVEAIKSYALPQSISWEACVNSHKPDKIYDKLGIEFSRIALSLQCINKSNQNSLIIDSCVDNAITAMFSRLEEESFLLGPRAIKSLIGTSSKASVGIALGKRDGIVFVVNTGFNTPARAEGIQSGDILVSIDEKEVKSLFLHEINSMIRGEDNTIVNLTVTRASSQPISFKLTREIIHALDSEFILEMRDNNLIINAISQLNIGSAEKLKNFTKGIEGTISAIIFDLRNNNGGLLAEVISIADLFLDHGEIVTSRGRTQNDVEKYNATEGQFVPNVRILVLTNRGTASGAEILASALQDNKRATVVGQKTAGIGTTRTLLALDDFHFIALTTSYQYRPNGLRIQNAPIIPDCEVDLPGELLLEHAIAIAKSGGTGCAPAPQP